MPRLVTEQEFMAAKIRQPPKVEQDSRTAKRELAAARSRLPSRRALIQVSCSPRRWLQEAALRTYIQQQHHLALSKTGFPLSPAPPAESAEKLHFTWVPLVLKSSSIKPPILPKLNWLPPRLIPDIHPTTAVTREPSSSELTSPTQFNKYPSIANTSLEDFDRTFSVNARGAFLCCREAANRLKRGGGGRIILISSSLALALRPGFGAYAASKAAVEAMANILAKELKGSRITANCVAPGPIARPMASELYFAGKTEEQIKNNIEECPHGRLGEPKDVVPVVGFWATDASEWVNGQVIRANGGYI
ncbi:Short-chain type dehydrogenase/reductase [Quillaja saponaria]|uniref:Short-chain type dehydrogenase/reductase n=1 Tax=Quillaja saponaria TaxID=32244 RepID=A0AAD7VDQ5_QUISA|nr:Short-chain type dehydrogenase/reductase [Quillaja saponaria]